MKVLFVNKFFYLRGGAERVFFEEAALLESMGHEVSFFSMHHPRNLSSRFEKYFVSEVNYEEGTGVFQKMKEAGRVLYSWEAKKKIRQLLIEESFDIVHFHNIYHQISPSIIEEVNKHNLPAVMTLHDYKMVCPTYKLLLNDQICERCAQGRYYHCLLQRCTKDSYAKSLLNVIEMYLHQKVLNQYGKVALFISPSRFLRDKLAEMGFPGKVVHLPNFIKLEDFTPRFSWQEPSIVYFGRLSPEKGVQTLIKAMPGLPVKLKVIGEGPERPILENIKDREHLENVEFLGYQQGRALKEEIKKAMFAVLPSECYENHPLAVLEAFALSKPVVSARIGGIPEMVRDFNTGLTFRPKSIQDLREKICYLLDNPELVITMGKNARRLAEEGFNPQKHYELLMEVYRLARKSV